MMRYLLALALLLPSALQAQTVALSHGKLFLGPLVAEDTAAVRFGNMGDAPYFAVELRGEWLCARLEGSPDHIYVMPGQQGENRWSTRPRGGFNLPAVYGYVGAGPCMDHGAASGALLVGVSGLYAWNPRWGAPTGFPPTLRPRLSIDLPIAGLRLGAEVAGSLTYLPDSYWTTARIWAGSAYEGVWLWGAMAGIRIGGAR